MSPTLLEGLVVLVLLVVAWQLGLILTPIILRELRGLWQSVDQVSNEIQADPDAEQQQIKEHKNGSQH